MDRSEFHAPGAGRVVTTRDGYAAFVPASPAAQARLHEGARPGAVARRRRPGGALGRRRRAARSATARRAVQASGGVVLVAHRRRRGDLLRSAARPGLGGAPERFSRAAARGARLRRDAALRRRATRRDVRSRSTWCASCTSGFCAARSGTQGRRASSGRRRTGSARRARRWRPRPTCRRPCRRCCRHSRTSAPSCRSEDGCPTWSSAPCCTSSSRPSIRSSGATVVSDVCSSRCS